MAGLTVKELTFRGLVVRILIITPANLTGQWRRELHDTFGETFNRNVGLALTVLQRRLASSVAAIRLSLERRRKRLKDLQQLGKLKQEYGELPEDLDDLIRMSGVGPRGESLRSA